MTTTEIDSSQIPGGRIGLLVSWLGLIAAAGLCRAETLELKGLFPAGAAVGQTTSITAIGQFPVWPVRFVCDHPGVAVQANDEAPGQLTVAIDADAEPGPCWIHVLDESGATRARRFVVSHVREVAENLESVEPLRVDLATPCVVNGILSKADEVDRIHMHLAAGQTLIANLRAHTLLGSPMDAVLQLVDASDGYILEQNDDLRGIDPRIMYTTSTDVSLELRVFAFPETPTSRIGFAGGDDFVYRLQITTGPLVDHGVPLSVNEQAWQSVAIAGPGTDEAGGSRRHRSPSSDVVVYRPGTVGYGRSSIVNVPTFFVSPRQTDETPEILPIPCDISGCLDDSSDAVFRFQAAGGDKVRFEVESQDRGFGLDAVLQATLADGSLISRVDDKGRRHDPSIDVTVPDSGQFDVRISDLHRRCSQDQVYLLRARRVTPKFELNVESEVFMTTVGEPISVPVTIGRLDGFDDPIDIVVVGLPTSVYASTSTSQMDSETRQSVQLHLKSDQPVASQFQVIGIAKDHSTVVVGQTIATVPREFHDHCRLVVVQPKER